MKRSLYMAVSLVVFLSSAAFAAWTVGDKVEMRSNFKACINYLKYHHLYLMLTVVPFHILQDMSAYCRLSASR